MDSFYDNNNSLNNSFENYNSINFLDDEYDNSENNNNIDNSIEKNNDLYSNFFSNHNIYQDTELNQKNVWEGYINNNNNIENIDDYNLLSHVPEFISPPTTPSFFNTPINQLDNIHQQENSIDDSQLSSPNLPLVPLVPLVPIIESTTIINQNQHLISSPTLPFSPLLLSEDDYITKTSTTSTPTIFENDDCNFILNIGNNDNNISNDNKDDNTSNDLISNKDQSDLENKRNTNPSTIFENHKVKMTPPQSRSNGRYTKTPKSCTCRSLKNSTLEKCSIKLCGCRRFNKGCSIKCCCLGNCSNGPKTNKFLDVWRVNEIRNHIIGFIKPN
ncbi:hypothetical protein DICPUDRAFT_150094 [Dictyostelium purpureum]|uniref:Tesmin/TSO1-like CXC domain-containing protein n=1 Tax=Dictyostelium purpureum TaxID=5786 RepID=F0ZFF6_DICPU|nr:uncharacterized protein DICPUDRAFT_150094 [Dictyostelium purpureum]EGC37328.1 hypothetical protein DICPUDRAFT_150094 [Dictyostelium purpureum]|eukprot:XP_003286142.1 hypothetical protein DICPUDRAFT_150094 [Dictyostelium purpureum]